jgi:hypothetical protein
MLKRIKGFINTKKKPDPTYVGGAASEDVSNG